MKKYFLFSDVHGQFNMLERELKLAGFDRKNSSHILISLGDLFDRGDENKEVLDFAVTMMKNDRMYNIMGNHDTFLSPIFSAVTFNSLHDVAFSAYYNGLDKTLANFSGYKAGDISENSKLILDMYDMMFSGKFNIKNIMESQPVAFITEVMKLVSINHGKDIAYLLDNSADAITLFANKKRNVLTHGGLSYKLIEERWEIDNWAKTTDFMKFFKPLEGDHHYFGHYGTPQLRKAIFGKQDIKDYSPFTFDNKTGIDAFNGVSGRINVVKIETDNNPELYFAKTNLKSLTLK